MNRRGIAASLLALALGGCFIEAPPNPEFTPLPETRPEQIEQVVFLVGDAGEAQLATSPVMVRVQQEVERWSTALAREEGVSVLLLGDNAYPVGIREPSDPYRPEDSLHLRAQAEMVNGPNARRWRNRGYFIAGNHDWGQSYGLEGLRRIRNQAEMLDKFAAEGMRVDLYPEAGLPGPAVVDAGENVRFVFMDTHWWLQADRNNSLRDTVFFNVDQILRNSGNRAVLFVLHHPFSSGGPHGGPVPLWRGFGILWLLNKTGSLVQDMNSPVYRELQGGMENLFKQIGRPLIAIGGHDHSLQVIEQDAPEKPQWTLVSGSASKVSSVGPARGMKFAADKPGFMKLAFRKDGGGRAERVRRRPRLAALRGRRGRGRHPVHGGGLGEVRGGLFLTAPSAPHHDGRSGHPDGSVRNLPGGRRPPAPLPLRGLSPIVGGTPLRCGSSRRPRKAGDPRLPFRRK